MIKLFVFIYPFFMFFDNLFIVLYMQYKHTSCERMMLLLRNNINLTGEKDKRLRIHLNKRLMCNDILYVLFD